MPQLAIETFVSQYFWFIVILVTFYFIAITQVIPRIAEIFKTRSKCASFVEEVDNNNKNLENKEVLNVYKNVSLGNKGLETYVISSNDIELVKAAESWVKKNIK
jgi:hypothetical protein